MKKIKQSFLKKDKGIKSERIVLLKSVDQVKSVLLVTDEENKSLKKEVEAQFSSASVYHLFQRTIKEDDSKGFYYTVHPSDFNLTGKIKNDKLRNLEDIKLDLLIDLSQNSVLLDYFIKRSNALMKIGTFKNNHKSAHYDLIIGQESNNTEQLNTIIKQLKTLTANGIEAV